MSNKIPISIYEESQHFNYIIILAYIIDSCNYNCLYCYNKMPRSNAIIELDNLFSLCIHIHNITGKKIKLELIGGEPTLHPKLIDFCQKAQKSNIISCFILTNFSQSLSYYNILLQCGTTLISTWHSIYNDKLNKRYIDKALSINKHFIKNDQLELRIMFEPDNFNNSKFVLNKLISADLTDCIQCSLLSIGSYDTHLYTKKQLDEYYQIISKIGGHKSIYHIKYDDGTIDHLQFNDMFLNNNFSFNHWICSAGKDYLYVHVNGNIYPCETYFYDIPTINIRGSIYKINKIHIKKTLCECKFCTSCDFGISKQKVFI